MVPHDQCIGVEPIHGLAVGACDLGLKRWETACAAVHRVRMARGKRVTGAIGEEAVIGFRLPELDHC